MAAVQRRIDALYCTREMARERARDILAEIEGRAQAARQEVSTAISQRLQALEERHKELISQIDRVAKQKAQALQRQIRTIEAGTCPPAPAEREDEEAEPDPGVFVLCADAVISFKIGEEDFLPKIANFGSITEASTYASRSYARGPALGIMKAGNPSYLWVYSCDKDGVRRTEGGDKVVAAVCSPPDFEKLEVEDMKDGRYRVSFLPLQPGTFSLRLSAAGEDVREGPFTLVVRAPTAYQLLGAEAEAGAKPKIGGGPDTAGRTASLGHPSGVDFDHTGRYIFVADQSNHRVQIFDTAELSVPVCVFGKKGLGPSDFDSPCDLVVDHENRVLVSDLLNHRVQVFEFIPRRREVRHLRSLQRNFQFPKGLGVTEHGHLLVCDSGNHRVQVFNMLDGFCFVREFGSLGTGEGQFTTPLDVAVNRNGEVLVSEAGNRISVFDDRGQFLRSFGAKGRKDGCFNYPTSLTVNDENAVFVCDQGNHRVQVLNASDGTFLHKWGGCKRPKVEGDDHAGDQAEEGEKLPDWVGMQKPSGVAVNSDGLVVVADYDGNVLWTF